MTAVSVLALRIEGPLQAWGDTAKWSVRDTRPEPTRSGIVGLVAAACGWGLDDVGDQRAADLSARVVVGVRADREGVSLRDYHTIGGTRSGSETPWAGLLTAEGKTKRNPTTRDLHTEVSERNYLCDACFLVMLEADETTLHGIEDALRSPVWPPFLGRKACTPSAPICPARPDAPNLLSGPLTQEIAAFPWLGRESDPRPKYLRVVADETSGAADGMRGLRHDVPESFRHRRFRHRYVREFQVPTPGFSKEE